MGIRGEVFSSKAHTAKRVYFFNVKENRNGDLFLNMVESKKAEEGQNFERHSMIIFEEDLDVFLESLEKSVRYIRRVQGRDENPTLEREYREYSRDYTEDSRDYREDFRDFKEEVQEEIVEKEEVEEVEEVEKKEELASELEKETPIN